MTATVAPAEVVVPDDASALEERCSAKADGTPCPNRAKWRALLTCPTCDRSAARPLCDGHMQSAAAPRLKCVACREERGLAATLRLIAVEPMR